MLKYMTDMHVTLSVSRDERKWIEKQNRASRAQRKKEEMNRIRTLVGTKPANTHCKIKDRCNKDLWNVMDTRCVVLYLQILPTAVTQE